MLNKFPKNISQYKLIVSDFDGTLAGADNITTPKIQRAVERWIDSGKKFTIATGRQYLMIDDECKKMGLTTPVIVRGGAELVDPVTDEILHSEYINKSDVSKIIRFIEKSKLFLYGIEIDDIIYSNFKIAVEFPKISFKKPSDFKIQSVPKLHLKPKNADATEAELHIKKLMHELPEVHAIATHNNKFGKGWDVTSVRATKLHGIVKVMGILGIKRKEIVGVGDSYNDFPLLGSADFKVAMGNAIDELKGIADIVISSNEEDGVAYLIEQLLKNNKE